MDVGEYIRRKQGKQKSGSKSTPNMSAEEAFNRYGKLSEEQLLQELFKTGGVSNGQVSGEELDAFLENVKPYISREQAARMKELIAQLKRS